MMRRTLWRVETPVGGPAWSEGEAGAVLGRGRASVVDASLTSARPGGPA